ncbi:hypothetical protein VTO73DRAFT_4183 [Trametes versicolor]
MDGTSDTASTRPRRSARTPAKPPAKTPASAAPPPESPARPRQKAREAAAKSSPEKLEYLLSNTKSKLTRVEMTEVINYPIFLDLPEEVQNRLCALLPSTAFSTFSPSVCPTHPDYDATGDGDQMQVDYAPDDRTSATLDPTVFTSPYFLSAAHTFQDHLFSSWMGKKAADDLTKFEESARSGAMHIDWKDEVWEREHQRLFVNAKGKQPPRADMATLAKGGLLQAGDILAYKRCFPALNVTVEKDVLIDSVDPQTNFPTFLLAPGAQKELPRDLLTRSHSSAESSMSTAGFAPAKNTHRTQQPVSDHPPLRPGR